MGQRSPLPLPRIPVISHLSVRRGSAGSSCFEYVSVMPHPHRTTVFALFVHRYEQRKLLVCVTSDKLFHRSPQLLPRLGSAYLTAEPGCGAFIRSLTQSWRCVSCCN